MERRNIDFEVAISRDQWDTLGRTAAALPDPVLAWTIETPEQIELRIRGDDAPTGFAGFVAVPGRYGVADTKVAEIVFNDGRPFAALEPPPEFMPPNITRDQEQALEGELQRWVRNKWHVLVDEAGVRITG